MFEWWWDPNITLYFLSSVTTVTREEHQKGRVFRDEKHSTPYTPKSLTHTSLLLFRQAYNWKRYAWDEQRREYTGDVEKMWRRCQHCSNDRSFGGTIHENAFHPLYISFIRGISLWFYSEVRQDSSHYSVSSGDPFLYLLIKTMNIWWSNAKRILHCRIRIMSLLKTTYSFTDLISVKVHLV